MPTLMHVASMQRLAGVEVNFSDFLSRAVVRYADWTQAWLNPASSMHTSFREPLAKTLTHADSTKYYWGFKLPAKPAALRRWHCRRVFAKALPDVLVIWNRTAKVNFVVDAMGEDRCIHWERGAIWHSGHERDRRRYLSRIPVAIANSTAASRMLRLAWDYRGDVRVCRNVLRPSLSPTEPVRKTYPRAKIRIGVAARLFPTKGIPLALHALRLLRAQSFDAELDVAGAGPELEELKLLARRLGVLANTHFRGAVSDMRSFYSEVDCLLHSPLTEAFGLVALEAAAHGCPVIAAAVDGLPEAVEHGVSGYCVRPTLPVSDYPELGGSLKSIPKQVYDPAKDELQAPLLVDPADLAAAVMRLFSDRAHYEKLSTSASEHVLRNNDFDTHVDAVMGVIAGLNGRK